MSSIRPDTLARRVAGCALLLATGTFAQRPAPGPSPDGAKLAKRFCAECHSGAEAEAELDILRLLNATEPTAAARLLDVRDAVEAHDMPPEDEAQPTPAQRRFLVEFIEHRIQAQTSRPDSDRDPGQITMRRLSRVEYRNTVNDVLGIDPRALVEGFPVDDLGYGFDNVGSALSVSTLHVEKYAAAAADLAQRAVPSHHRIDHRQSGADLIVSRRNRRRGDAAALITNGSATGSVSVPVAGRYRIEVLAYATQAGDELARMVLHVGPRTVGSFEVSGTARAAQALSCEVELVAGEHRVAAEFVNDYYEPRQRDPRRRDRNLIVRRIAVTGPIGDRAPTAFESGLPAATWGGSTAAARARAVVPQLLSRLWRRPPSRHEVVRMTELILRVAESDDARSTDPTDPFRAGLRLALRAALASPHFLFRVEMDNGPTPRDLTGYELATRLSYFLWSSTPDRTLTELAAAKPNRRAPLARLDTLRGQVRRMLDDPRARSLATNFAAQWLELRSLGDAKPDPDRFPKFDSALRDAMRTEVELCVQHVIRNRLPVEQLVTADWTFVDQRLAQHYGIAGVRGSKFRRVSTAGTIRGGILGHAALLTVTSHPVRTSPVRRGKWILENVLGDPPPPPPPMVDSFPDGTSPDTPSGLREAMRRHREQATCAVCHRKMDALGLALEAFDALGRHRPEVDSSGTLPDGTRLGGPQDLRRVLGGSRKFVRCLTRKLFIFAVGRGPTPADELGIDALTTALGARPTFEDLVQGIVALPAFRRRTNAH